VSVHFDNGERCSLSSGLAAGSSWTFRCWFRLNSYASNFTWGAGVANGVGSPSVIAIDCNETASGDLNVFIYTGSFQAVTLHTGSFTGWTGIAVTHVGGTTAYNVYACSESDSSMTLIGTLDVGSEINPNVFIAGDGGFGDPANCDIRAFGVTNTAESAGTIFTALSTFATYNGSANHTFLALTAAATAGTNAGTAGNYTVTGTPVDETDEPVVGGGGGETIALAQGAYTHTGQAVAFRRGLVLQCSAGSYAHSGQAVTLAGPEPQLQLAQGSYSHTGQAVGLKRGLRIVLESATSELEGDDTGIGLYKGWRLAADQGSYQHTGQAVGLKVWELALAQGSYAHTGQPVTMRRGKRLPADAGSYAHTGQAVALSKSSSLQIALAAGVFTHSGQAVALLRALRGALVAGSYAHAGQAVALGRGKVISLNAGSYVHAGQAASFRRALRVNINSGLYSHSGQPMLQLWGRRLQLAQGLYAHAGHDADFWLGLVLALAPGAYTHTGQDVILEHTALARLVAQAGSYLHIGQPIGLQYLSGFRLASAGRTISDGPYDPRRRTV
jgi:hypothetical protein